MITKIVKGKFWMIFGGWMEVNPALRGCIA